MKSYLLALSALFLLACTGGPSAETDLSDQPDETQVDANQVKTAADEALAATKENHEMRKEIFELKGKLGLPQDNAPAAAPAKK